MKGLNVTYGQSLLLKKGVREKKNINAIIKSINPTFYTSKSKKEFLLKIHILIIIYFNKINISKLISTLFIIINKDY